MKQLMMYHKMDVIRPSKRLLPEGYTLRTYRPGIGDEEAWVEISKCGIINPASGVEAFTRSIAERPGVIPENDTFFVCRPDGTPGATLTAFKRPNGEGEIHMVTAMADMRGFGVGQIMLCHGMQHIDALMGDEKKVTELTTDDWRLPAIVGYLREGFHPVLYDEKMEERWRKVAWEIGMHGIEFLDIEGNETGIIL